MTSAMTAGMDRGRRDPAARVPCHLVILSLTLLAAGCDLPGKPKEEERPLFPAQVSAFDRLFNQNCIGCHGEQGKFGPAPPLNEPLFRAGISEKELTDLLTSGRKGTQMPGFLKVNGGLLTKEQIQILVHEIKGQRYKVTQEGESERARLEVTRNDPDRTPAWGTPAKLPEGAPPYRAPEGEAGDKARGATVFAHACATCHGTNGKGGEMNDKSWPINDRAFLALVSDQFLRRLIITGRADLGMPTYAEAKGRPKDFKPLSSQDVADVVALLKTWRQGGAVSGK